MNKYVLTTIVHFGLIHLTRTEENICKGIRNRLCSKTTRVKKLTWTEQTGQMQQPRLTKEKTHHQGSSFKRRRRKQGEDLGSPRKTNPYPFNATSLYYASKPLFFNMLGKAWPWFTGS